MKKLYLGLIAMLIWGMTLANAAGPHDGITCVGCHSPHFAVDNKLFAVKNTQAKNPLTGQSVEGMVAAKCMGCHQVAELGGAGVRPIHLDTTHPIGIKPNPRIADVPENLLVDGKLDCTSCHEPHPSNSNFMYLRVNTGKQGENLQNFCAMCHSSKADLKVMGIKDPKQLQVFSAMDEQKGSGSFARDQVTINNKTKEYVKPLGPIPANDLTPNYQNPPAWVYAPDMSVANGGNGKKAPAKK